MGRIDAVIRRGRRQVRVAKVRFATPEEVEANRQSAESRRPDVARRLFLATLKAEKDDGSERD